MNFYLSLVGGIGQVQYLYPPYAIVKKIFWRYLMKRTFTMSICLLMASGIGIVIANENNDVFSPAAGVLAKFEFNGNVNDSSGNGRDATLLGGGFVDTPWGQGFHVFANDSMTGIDWSSYASLLHHPYTVEIVITPQGTESWGKLFGFDDKNDNGWYYKSEGLQAYPNSVVGSGQVQSGEQHYIAFVSTATDKMEIYYQGKLLGPTNTTFEAPPFSAIFFYDDTATGRNEQLNAVVEALRISEVARTPAEIFAVQTHLYPKPPENGGFTQADIDNAIEQGKQACISDPASCGISVSDSGTPASGDCMANYSPDGQLHVPCVSVPDAFGGTTVYDIKLNQQTGSFTFDLDMGSVKPR
jgi:hypothetical protein